MAITLRQLAIFEKVALLGNATRAGAALFISQSAVSMALAEVEKLCGGESSPALVGGSSSTSGGDCSSPRRRISCDGPSRRQTLQEGAADPAGLLRAGASTTIGNYLLPAILGQFARRYPRAEIALQVGNTRQISEEVLSGSLDVGLIEGRCPVGELECSPWRDDVLVVIVGPEHPWAEGGKATAAMLAAAPWIMREQGSGTREVFERAMARLRRPYRIALELGHTEAIKKAVEGGLGVSSSRAWPFSGNWGRGGSRRFGRPSTFGESSSSSRAVSGGARRSSWRS